MDEQTTARVRLGRVGRRLSSWRAAHGGRGRPIPKELWAEAVSVAALAGVRETARVLGVDRERLVRRMELCSSGAEAPAALDPPARGVTSSLAFVEVDAHRVFSRGKTVVRLTSRGGEQLEIELEGGAMDVATLACTLWNRSR